MGEHSAICRAFIFSTDDYFTAFDHATGAAMYEFDPGSLKRYHHRNQERCKVSMELGISPLFVDNTNSALWEMRAYVELARKHRYAVHIMDPRTLSRDAFNLDVLGARCQVRSEQTGKVISQSTLE